MTRRRLLLTLFVVILLIGVGGWFTFGGVKIQPGMSRAEVEAILGPPDGQMLAIGVTAVDNIVLIWKSGRITVEFDESNCVRVISGPPTFFDNLRSWLGY